MTQLDSLKSATTLSDVAHLLEFKPSALSHIIYRTDPSAKYVRFEISKRSGGARKILAPAPSLKLLQRRLSTLLQNCLQEIEHAKGVDDASKHPDRISHGFKRRRSIVTNANLHKRRRFVFNVDIEDFFGQLNFGRVRGFFIGSRDFGLAPKVATVLAQIACFENSLPQGSPCSPIISNLIGHILDIELVRLARAHGCMYTRYADDLTFSTNKATFPSEIAVQTEPGSHEWRPGAHLEGILRRNQFQFSAKKTRMQYRTSRQEVTGLVVNQKPNIKSDYRHRVRAMVDRLVKTGSFQLQPDTPPGTLAQLHGMLGFIYSVDVHNFEIAKLDPQRSLLKRRGQYRRFLFYSLFYATDRPIVVCEGRTDNVYLVHAIRSLFGSFPQLARMTNSNDVEILLRRFKYSGSSTESILGINGGSNDLGRFAVAYREEIGRFLATGQRHPVILLVDNDKGAKPVFSTIKEITKTPVTGAEDFVHVFANLYLCATPTPAGAVESKIEDFFDQQTLAVQLDGKSFSASDDFDRSTHYGKSDFARRVVAANAAKIDFSAFHPLLSRFAKIIDHHAQLHGRT